MISYSGIFVFSSLFSSSSLAFQDRQKAKTYNGERISDLGHSPTYDRGGCDPNPLFKYMPRGALQKYMCELKELRIFRVEYRQQSEIHSSTTKADERTYTYQYICLSKANTV